jgi:hypothetical protein
VSAGAADVPGGVTPVADPPAGGGPRALVALALLGTALRLALVWTGWCDNHVVADDAFYYFTIARHLAAGHGATFDGLAPTNGFHPLWLLLLTPLFGLARALRLGSWSTVHLALSLCALLDLASGVLLWRLLRRLGCPRGAPWAAAVWFLSPFTVLLSLRGLESALDVTLVAVWLLLLARAFRTPPRAAQPAVPGARAGPALGLATGLAFLARTDNGPLLALALGVTTAAAALRARAGWGRGLALLLATGAVALLVALPWFLWNLARFGTPWQVSGAAKLANPQIFGHVPHDAASTLAYLVAFVWVPAFFVAGESMKHRAAFQAIAGVEWAALLALLPSLVRSLGRAAPAPRRSAALAAGVFLAAHATVYVLLLRTYVAWYATVPVFLLVVLFAGLAGEALAATLPRARRRALAALALAFAAATFGQFFHATRIQPRGEEQVVRPILTRIAHLAPGARTVGAFNAGAAGYFAPDVGSARVVNLDGLVNNRAVEAWRAGRYLEYLERNVDVVIDDADATLNLMLGPGNRGRFDARYPQWSPGSLVHGPQPRTPTR